ncbi:MAG: F0F1 ATP synthase subunit A [Solirubrobacteraceae bacterium]
MSTRAKVLLGFGLLAAVMIALFAVTGSHGMNTEYQPQNEFKLDDWISIHAGGLNLSINKAVLYLFLASGLTAATLVYVARRMEERPNKVQTAVEVMWGVMRDNITGPNNLDREMALQWFPFIGALFLFILYSNIIGYLPLPVNSEETFNLFGAHIPAFQVYAATANISVTLVLSLMVWVSYNAVGVRKKGFVGYLKSWLPAGMDDVPARAFMVPFVFGIETISHFVRIISLAVRLFANMLAGHLLILFMGGGLVVLVGVAALGPLTLIVATLFFIFEVVLIAGLQAFIFATLTAIYLGGAVAESH